MSDGLTKHRTFSGPHHHFPASCSIHATRRAISITKIQDPSATGFFASFSAKPLPSSPLIGMGHPRPPPWRRGSSLLTCRVSVGWRKAAQGCRAGGAEEKVAQVPARQLAAQGKLPTPPHLLQQPVLIHFTEFTFTLLNATKPPN